MILLNGFKFNSFGPIPELSNSLAWLFKGDAFTLLHIIPIKKMGVPQSAIVEF